uniref:protein FAR-RED IMPAIRED RESPONSE 1-like n=1 Tax=Erigeron canadensis TaxID=72917 RepID=UPI001CB8B017|nr:protein FAR-RED IMPAIRED RESPONSE 1-like [Erigeron canadensis]
MNKGFNTFVVESGGYENVPFTEKDCRNYIDKVKRLKFGEGDAEAIQSYFTKVQSSDRDFFYMWDLDDENRLKSLFWADARCRAAYEEFGDVITFDTTYLTNEYEMPMAPFVGVNHHGQSILLGCGLISNEDNETFTWLFRSWLACMSGRPPQAIITYQDQAMKNAIQNVFPDARHRWCLWHIMRKLLEKLGIHKKYKFIKYKLKKVVYDSFVPSEFEDAWNIMLESESINAFFDKYVNKKTTLKQFVEQYENALRDRAEKENKEDFNSYNTHYPPITRYAMEEQMREIFTHAKFKEFTEELTGKMYCGIGSLKTQDGISEYEVIEDVMVNGNLIKKPFVVSFKKGDSGEESDVRCICRLFEYRGMLCRHALTVLINENINLVPDKYILRRWRKDVKRRHTKVKVTYNDWVDSDEGRRYSRMCSAFSMVADLASKLEEKCNLVLNRVSEIMSEVSSKKTVHDNFICTPGQSTSPKNSTKILDPLVVRRKGRPMTKRLKSHVEQIITKKPKKKKKLTEVGDEEVGCEVDNDLPKKKRTMKEKAKNQNENVYPSTGDASQSVYANSQPHYSGFLPSYPMQHHQFHVQSRDMFHQVSPQQYVGFQVQKSSQGGVPDASLNPPNTQPSKFNN